MDTRKLRVYADSHQLSMAELFTKAWQEIVGRAPTSEEATVIHHDWQAYAVHETVPPYIKCFMEHHA